LNKEHLFFSGTALLCHRLFIKGHQLVDINLSKGCFRPKPIDCMLLFIIFYNLRKYFIHVNQKYTINNSSIPFSSSNIQHNFNH
jgi:hypothetical protein